MSLGSFTYDRHVPLYCKKTRLGLLSRGKSALQPCWFPASAQPKTMAGPIQGGLEQIKNKKKNLKIESNRDQAFFVQNRKTQFGILENPVAQIFLKKNSVQNSSKTIFFPQIFQIFTKFWQNSDKKFQNPVLKTQTPSFPEIWKEWKAWIAHKKNPELLVQGNWAFNWQAVGHVSRRANATATAASSTFSKARRVNF